MLSHAVLLTNRGGGVLIAVHLIESVFGGVDDERRRIVAAGARLQQQDVHHDGCSSYKKPWPMLTIGCTGEAAAAALTMDLASVSSADACTIRHAYHTSCFTLDTLLAGRNGSLTVKVDAMRREDDVQPVSNRLQDDDRGLLKRVDTGTMRCSSLLQVP